MAIGRTSTPPFPKKPDDLIQPAEPAFPYEFVNLADPPDDWMFLNVRFGAVAAGTHRTVRLGQMAVLMKHYFWGIHWSDPEQTKQTTRRAHSLKFLVRTLWKLFYYMQERHRPRNWDDILNIYRDTGPRLLRYDLTPRPEPISRWFTNPPHGQTVLLPAYSRPDDAPLDLPDIILQQYLYSANSFNPPTAPQLPIQPQLPFQQPPTNAQLQSNFNFVPAPPHPPPPPPPLTEEQQNEYLQNNLLEFLRGEQAVPGEKRDARGLETSPNKRRRNVSPGAPTYWHSPEKPAHPLRDHPVFAARNVLEWNWMPGLHPEHVAPPVDEPQIGPIIPTPEPVYEDRTVSEAVEKALMQLVYADLDRDPSIPLREKPVNSLTAHSFNDMMDMKIGVFNTTANVRLSPLTFEWDPTGAVFPLRGRGPVWSGNSCATDCVIVIGMLLDVGCTKIDRANNRIAEFTQQEAAYIEITNAPWETFDEAMSIRVRDEFLQSFLNGQQHLKMGEPLPPWALWSQVTKSFAQFRYHHIERVTPCKCQGAQQFINSHQGSCILPGYRNGDEKGVSAGTLIERCFYARKSFACTNCGDPIGVTGERKIGQLPLRLVMTFDNKTRLRNHTQNIKFRYIDYEDNKQVAHYRWLGGVYNNELHARVYWNDSKRGDQTGGEIMMYDSELNKGVLVGGIAPFKQDDRVPLEWVNHKSIPLLFYERVMDPSRELLATAHNAVYDMGNILGRNKSILEAHVPWSPPALEPQPELWGRVLSNAGERFNDFNPTWALNPPNPSPARPATAINPNFNPNLLDPGVVDPSLLDPTLYSTTIPPTFDISSLFDPTVGEELYTNEYTQSRPEDRFKNHMFGSMLEPPGWLNQNTPLWPSGQPSQEGALEFPDLPSWPSPRGMKNRSRTSQSDTSMPDADESPPGSRHSKHTAGLKTVVMVNQAIDPKRKAAHKAKEEQRKLQEYMDQAKNEYYARNEEKEKQEKREKREKDRTRIEIAEEEQQRKQQEIYNKMREEEAEAYYEAEPETAEERRLRKKREREKKEREKEKQEKEPETYNQRAHDKKRPEAIRLPQTPGSMPQTPYSMPPTPGPAPRTPGPPVSPTTTAPATPKYPMSGDSTPRQPYGIEEPSTVSKQESVAYTTGRSAFSKEAEAKRQEEKRRENIAKREAKQRQRPQNSKIGQMRQQHAECKEERGRKGKKKDDDPAWIPDGEGSEDD